MRYSVVFTTETNRQPTGTGGRRNHGHNREGGCKRKKLYFGTEVFKMEAYAYWVVFERSNQKKGTYLTRRTK